jgi:hypothetical protein
VVLELELEPAVLLLLGMLDPVLEVLEELEEVVVPIVVAEVEFLELVEVEVVDKVVDLEVAEVDATVLLEVLEVLDVADVEEEVLLEVVVELDETPIVLVPEAEAENSNSLLLEASAIHRFPEESKAIPWGVYRLVWLVPGTSPPKDDCPITNDALSPVESGVPNSSTRWRFASETQRFPEWSNATPSGAYRPDGVRVGVRDPKPVCPITSEAISPLENGAVNSITLLLPLSATQRFPEGANATLRGE